jgi:hypothetical protein
MKMHWRRYEVLFPLQFNDGNPVPRRWRGEAVLELAEHFGGSSLETQLIKGHWRHSGVIYRDNLARLVVEVPDTLEHRKWMKQFKERWRVRLKQIELWMVSYRIEVD